MVATTQAGEETIYHSMTESLRTSVYFCRGRSPAVLVVQVYCGGGGMWGVMVVIRMTAGISPIW